MAFVSGMMEDANKDEEQDKIAQLQRLQEQISNLIEEQRKQQEYYLLKKRNLNATASMSANDAIITPKGTVYTHPDDYIIATKKPGDLMSGGGNVYIKVINNSPSTVTTEQGTGDDGAKLITVLVDQVVQNGLASGKYDRAMNAARQRTAGRRVQA
jgi:hypothetical protein